MIYSIIRRLEKNQEITKDEKGVIAMMLKEFMARDKEEHGLVKVEMSPEMFKQFSHFAYTKDGKYNPEIFNQSIK
jgi:hypothetical protein